MRGRPIARSGRRAPVRAQKILDAPLRRAIGVVRPTFSTTATSVWELLSTRVKYIIMHWQVVPLYMASNNVACPLPLVRSQVVVVRVTITVFSLLPISNAFSTISLGTPASFARRIAAAKRSLSSGFVESPAVRECIGLKAVLLAGMTHGLLQIRYPADE